MSQQQRIEKTTHLQNQLERLKQMELSIQQTLEIFRFYNSRLSLYS